MGKRAEDLKAWFDARSEGFLLPALDPYQLCRTFPYPPRPTVVEASPIDLLLVVCWRIPSPSSVWPLACPVTTVGQ